MTHKILINHMSFSLPNSKTLFNTLTLAFTELKTGLVGRNGIGKSTLIKLMMGELYPTAGSIHIDGKLAYVPQDPLIMPETTIADFLGFEEKINALHHITQGSLAESDFEILNDDWNVEEDMQQQLKTFGLDDIPYNRSLTLLSGGEVTRLFLTKAFYSNADFILLDEPTNHLDSMARTQLYDAIRKWPNGLIVISHDRTLLNLMDDIIELNTQGAQCYGGNFDFYNQQKEIETIATEQQLSDAKKALNKTERSIQSTKEKHEQRQAQGRELRHSRSQAKIILDAMANRSTKSLGELSTRHQRMLENAEEKLQSAKEKIENLDEIQVELPKTKVPQGKIILNIENISFIYSHASDPIIQDFDFTLQGAMRIALKGPNGSGKTTLVKLILGELLPQKGNIYLGTNYVSYLDQTLNQLEISASILNNFMRLNPDAKENDAYKALATFLIKNVSALKLVKHLSGGEKLRAMLACVLMSDHPPQLLILDEPTNHLDIHSIRAIESALASYQGAMIVISHDEAFLKNIKIEREIYAPYIK